MTVPDKELSNISTGKHLSLHEGIEARDMTQGNTGLFALQFPDQSCGCKIGF
jgi:hypothetical protein